MFTSKHEEVELRRFRTEPWLRKGPPRQYSDPPTPSEQFNLNKYQDAFDRHDFTKDLPTTFDETPINVKILDRNYDDQTAYCDLFRPKKGFVTLFLKDEIRPFKKNQFAIFIKGYLSEDDHIFCTHSLANLTIPEDIYNTKDPNQINQWIRDHFQIIGTYQHDGRGCDSRYAAVWVNIKETNKYFELPSVILVDGNIIAKEYEVVDLNMERITKEYDMVHINQSVFKQKVYDEIKRNN